MEETELYVLIGRIWLLML